MSLCPATCYLHEGVLRLRSNPYYSRSSHLLAYEEVELVSTTREWLPPLTIAGLNSLAMMGAYAAKHLRLETSACQPFDTATSC